MQHLVRALGPEKSLELAETASKSDSNDPKLLTELANVYQDDILTDSVVENINEALFEPKARDLVAEWLQNIPLIRPRAYLAIKNTLDDAVDTHSDETAATAEHLLDLLEYVYLDGTTEIPGEMLDLLFSLVGAKNESLASHAAKVIVCCVSRPENDQFNVNHWWNSILLALSRSHNHSAYKSWLAWVRSTNALVKPEAYRDLLAMNDYWDQVRLGVVQGSNSYECTKYSLQILGHSIKDIDRDLDLPLMKWEMSGRQRFLNGWSRYVALVEIVSIDTSANQTQDSADDFVSFLSQESVIPPAWAIALLQTALTSNMEAIKSFISGLVLELGEQFLQMFAHNIDFLTHKLIPYALTASHFTTENGSCPYERKVSSFVSRLCRALPRKSLPVFVTETMDEFYENRYSFEAPKVVVCMALVDSLPEVLDLPTLQKVANVSAAALQSYKSEVMGGLLSKACQDIILYCADMSTVPVDEGLKLVLKMAMNGLETIDVEQVAAWIPESWLPELQARAASKAIFRLLYIYKSDDYSIPLDQHELPELVLYLSSRRSVESFKMALTSQAQAALAEGPMGETMVDALQALVEKPALSLPSTEGATLIEMLPELEVKSLRQQDNGSELLDLLEEKAALTGYLDGKQRSLHGSSMRYIFDAVPAQEATWPRIVDLAAQAFLHDKMSTRIAALDCVQRHVDSLPAATIARATNIGEALETIWEALKEYTLRASERDLHLRFIKLLTSAKVVAIEAASQSLEDICSDVILQSHARRNLLVPLTKGLVESTDKYPAWLSRVLVRSYTFLQTPHHAFHLETILAFKHGVYEKSWGAPEQAARVYAIKTLSQGQNAQEVSEFVLHDPSFLLLSPGKRHDGDEERRRILCFQILTLLEPFWTDEFAIVVADALQTAINVEPSPSARVYVEWIIARVVVRRPDELVNRLVLDKLANNLQPRFVSSLGRIGLLVGNVLGPALGPDFYQSYLNVVLPMSSSNRAPVRHFSVAMLYAIHLDPKLRQCLSKEMLALVDGVASCAESVENFKDFRSGDDCVWSINDELTLVGVCGGVSTRVTGRTVVDTLSAQDFASVLGPGNYGETASKHRAQAVFHDVSMIRDSIRVTNENIQTKSGAFDDVDEPQRSELIVVATLCDKPPNLGGICRLCDALGAKLLTLNDLSVVKHHQFKSTAVTADKWMPMREVPESKLIEFMHEKKREGYTLVGMEQTDNSRKLKPSLQFPKKTLLVMGREREGIPGEVLAHLDFCVEIEQWGVVRSMNIQTATAVMVNAYNHQH